jgi:ankyrin repeat protein
MTREWDVAIRTGDLDNATKLLDGGSDINALDKYGQTALMRAAHRGNVSLVRLLTDRGADLNVSAKYGLTALMLAVIANHTEVVEVLLAAGADVTRRGSERAAGVQGMTAEELARAPNREKILAVFGARRA